MIEIIENVLSTIVVVSTSVFLILRFVFEDDPFPKRYEEFAYASTGLLLASGGASLFSLLMMRIWL